MDKPPPSPSRRAFLKILTAGAAAVGTSGLAHPRSRQGLRIGVLLPTSQLYPHLGTSFLSGLRLALSHAAATEARDAMLLTAGAGTTPSQAVKATEELLAVQHADLLVGMIGSNATADVKPLLGRYRRPFLAATTGVDTERAEERDPLVAKISLGGWQATWEAGAWAVRKHGGRGVVITSRYDSGYDHVYTLASGIEAAGGELLQTLVTDDNRGGHDFYAAIMEARRRQPDFVILLHSHPLALATLAQLDPGLFADVPFVTSGIVEVGASDAVASVTPWSARSGTAANREFVIRYSALHGAPPDSFGLLGYETGRLLDIATGAGAVAQPHAFLETLRRLRFESPRGELGMQPGSTILSAPRHLFDPSRGWNSIELPGELRPGYANAALETLHASPRTGWLHDYLCV